MYQLFVRETLILPQIPIILLTLKILSSFRKPRTLTNSSLLIIRTLTHTSPTLNRRRRIRTTTTDLLEIYLVPIPSICDTFKESVVLRGAHCVDRNVEMPVLAHVVYLFLDEEVKEWKEEGMVPQK
jgi:hypothetical protein